MFIRPHVTRKKTKEWSATPVVLGQPVGLAIASPKMRRVSWNISGHAMRKNMSPAIRDVRNFVSCFLPLHPHPQSLKRPIYSVQRKFTAVLPVF